MSKKEKLTLWHKKKSSMIASKYLKTKKTEDAGEKKKIKEPLSAAQVYADKFTREIKKAFE